ncbi:uncharacterized protein TNCV_4692241 [Trichonephila clavipes]|nr:uncharacterized protein TNCV_4692241 [Trichonephila clavipes]
MSSTVALSTTQVTIRFNLVPPQFPWGGQGPSTYLSLPPTSREDLWLDGYLEYPHAAKTLYIHQHSCLLRYSNPGSTAQQSGSLTTIPHG